MAIARLTRAPIELEALAKAIASPGCGAVVLFAGTVRDHAGGRRVRAITYHGYERMALAALERIAGELEAATPGLRVALVHRLGEIAVGETSVGIATSSPHREAAYAANRSALERLKHEVPIWKQEHYADGGAAWRETEALDP
jgi:molybdopterin synthase catalytic subunit